MIYSVRHTTMYSYAQAVVLCQNQAWVQPRSCEGQSCQEFALEISPEPSVRRPWTDSFGNRVWYFAFDQPHHELTVTALSRISRWEIPAVDKDDTPSWEAVREPLRKPRDLATRRACQFVPESPLIHCLPEAADYAEPSFTAGRPLLAAVLDLSARIHADFEYDPQATALHTPTAEVFLQRRGVCQDFAQLAICCLRTLGLAVRYVSGYLLTEPPPGQEKLVGADASHAWVSVYCPPSGWIDVDPTNNCIPGMRHVVAAWGRDYSDVAPIRGMFVGGGRHTMTVAVDVKPAT
jgi:transglutaminase-like putative cysteine protease